MKRFGMILLVLAMMLTLTAHGEKGGETGINSLDAAFDSGKPTLTEKSSAVLKIAPEDLVITDELIAFAAEWGTGIDKDTLETAKLDVLQQELKLISQSPTGRSGIIQGESEVFALYEGKCRLIYPSGARSVEGALIGGSSAGDATKLWKYWMSFYNNVSHLLHEEGFVYSPDGRYAAIPAHGDRVYDTAMDPIIIDLSTGEMIQIAEYNYNNVQIAAFSADNRYYWYVLSGSFEEGNRRLYRYDLETGETELCGGGTVTSQIPDLAELQDGSWMLTDPLNDTLLTAFRNEDTWAFRETALTTGPMKPTRLLYSHDSGMACLILKKGEMAGDEVGLALCAFQPDNGFAGLDRFLCATRDSHEIVSLSDAKFEEAYQAGYGEYKNARGKTVTRFVPELFPYELIDNIFMSPDGNYLLMKTHSRETLKDENVSSLFLVRLSDLTTRDIQGLDPVKIGYRVSSYPMVIEWNTDEMIIGTDEGLKIYTFIAGK